MNGKHIIATVVVVGLFVSIVQPTRFAAQTDDVMSKVKNFEAKKKQKLQKMKLKPYEKRKLPGALLLKDSQMNKRVPGLNPQRDGTYSGISNYQMEMLERNRKIRQDSINAQRRKRYYADFKKAEQLRKKEKDYSEHVEGANRYIRAKCAQYSKAGTLNQPITTDRWYKQWCGVNNPYTKK